MGVGPPPAPPVDVLEGGQVGAVGGGKDEGASAAAGRGGALPPASQAPRVVKGQPPEGPETRGPYLPETQVRQISWFPPAFVADNLLSAEECDHLVALATPEVQRSTVVGSAGTPELDTIRTSFGMFIMRKQDEVVARIDKRVARFAGVEEVQAEDMQVLRYEHGQKYGAHQDTFLQSALNEVDGMQRTATVLLYLSDVEFGGETAFPESMAWMHPEEAWREEGKYSPCGRKGVSVKAKKGRALLFFHLDEQGQPSKFSMHTGCPVLEGVKWTSTKWIHERPFRSDVFPKGAVAPLVPTPPAGHCTDADPLCPDWAASGECESNKNFMVGDSQGFRGRCMESCGLCDAYRAKVAASGCPEGDALCLRMHGIRP